VAAGNCDHEATTHGEWIYPGTRPKGIAYAGHDDAEVFIEVILQAGDCQITAIRGAPNPRQWRLFRRVLQAAQSLGERIVMSPAR
jgi:hypothetical protein